MLAGEDFRGRHQRRLAAGLQGGGRGEQGHHRLAGADVALQQPQHAGVGGKVGADGGQRLFLGAREGERQRRQDSPRQRPVTVRGPPAGLLLPGADKGEGQLVGQHLVEGEASPGGAGGSGLFRRRRAVEAGDGLVEGRPLARRRHRRRDPFGELRHPPDRRVDGAAQVAGGKTLDQRVDLLHLRQPGEPGGVQHPVGMGHLPHAVVERDAPAQPAGRAHGQHVLKPGAIHLEMRHHQAAAGIRNEGAVGRPAALGRVLVAFHLHFQRHIGFRDRLGDGRAGAPVHELRRHVEHEVENPRRFAPEQARERAQQLGPDAGKTVEGCEKRIERGRTHGGGEGGRSLNVAQELKVKVQLEVSLIFLLFQ